MTAPLALPAGPKTVPAPRLADKVLYDHQDDFTALGVKSVKVVDDKTLSLDFSNHGALQFFNNAVRAEIRGVQLLTTAPPLPPGLFLSPVNPAPESVASYLNLAHLSGVNQVSVTKNAQGNRELVVQLAPYERIGSAGPVKLVGKGVSVTVPIAMQPKAADRLPELLYDSYEGANVVFDKTLLAQK